MENKSKRIVGGLLVIAAIVFLVAGIGASFYLNCHQVIWGFLFFFGGLVFLWGITLCRVDKIGKKDKG